MEYISDMDDDSEGDHEEAVIPSKKPHRPQYIAPLTMNKFAKVATNIEKKQRVNPPNRSLKMDSNLAKGNEPRRTATMHGLISSDKESQRQRETLEKKVTKANYINVGEKRKLVLANEDADEYDDTFHEGNAGPFQEAEQGEQLQSQADSEHEKEIGKCITGNKRGMTCGKGARKKMITSNKRLPLEFDFESRRVISENDSAFMHECGYIVRKCCTFQYKDWRLVPNEVRLPLRHKLTTLFDIDVKNSNVCKVIDSYMARAWRFHRAKLHNHFIKTRESKDLTQIKASPPDDTSKEDWEYLCDMWCDPKFLEIAKRGSMLVKTAKRIAETVQRVQYAITLSWDTICILHWDILTLGGIHIGIRKKDGHLKRRLQTMKIW